MGNEEENNQISGSGNSSEVGDNGHKAEAIPDAKDETKGSRKELSRSSIEHAFTQAQLPSALNMLVKPGDSAKEILMRTRFSKKTEGRIFAKALAFRLGRGLEFHDEAGTEVLLMLAAGFVSDQGLGRKELVEAITGERRHEENKGNFGDKIREMAFGKKNGEHNP